MTNASSSRHDHARSAAGAGNQAGSLATASPPPGWQSPQPQPPRDQPARAHPQAVLAVIAAGAIATVWLWWHGTPAVHGRAAGSPARARSWGYAVLIQETVAADSASISAVSGATYTSQGYISSLQSAIDKAGA